jgi:probable rRNA maturation factor
MSDIDAVCAARPMPGLPACSLELLEIAKLMHEQLCLMDGFDLRLVEDGEMAELNSQFLGLAGPTNVLSFPDESAADHMGHVAICADAVLRESLLYGQDPYEHFLRLLAHGLLHLAGHEHGEEMEQATERAVFSLRG